MAGSTWSARVVERTMAAQVRCVAARRELADAAATLVLAMLDADEKGVRDQAKLFALLRDASSNLTLAGSAMEAAEHLALRGAAASPTAPLASINLIPDGYGSIRLALGVLRCAREFAEKAYKAAERCRVRVWAASHLLSRPGLPGVDALLDAERAVAHRMLEAAQAFAVKSAALAVTAHWLVR
ncbi:hypothetical protein ACP70R_030516 [Stipagrostis hirtigluma subsp. patula]